MPAKKDSQPSFLASVCVEQVSLEDAPPEDNEGLSRRLRIDLYTASKSDCKQSHATRGRTITQDHGRASLPRHAKVSERRRMLTGTDDVSRICRIWNPVVRINNGLFVKASDFGGNVCIPLSVAGDMYSSGYILPPRRRFDEIALVAPVKAA